MKNMLSVIVVSFLTAPAHADAIDVGGKALDIPAPQGFVRVTPEMDAIYRLSLRIADPFNNQLAYYIAESDIPAAMSGDMPSLKRYFILKVNKKLEHMLVSDADFAELKDVTKRQNKEAIASIRSQAPGLLKTMSDGISEEFDVSVALRLSQLVPLDPHYETDNAFAYSMYINYGASVQGPEEEFISSATTTMTNVAGRILFLYCYGPQEDLEWTRHASQVWASAVVNSNPQPPSVRTGSRGMDWNKVVEKAISGAIVGGLGALIFGVLSKSRKRGG